MLSGCACKVCCNKTQNVSMNRCHVGGYLWCFLGIFLSVWTGPGRRLRGPEPGAEDDSVSDFSVTFYFVLLSLRNSVLASSNRKTVCYTDIHSQINPDPVQSSFILVSLILSLTWHWYLLKCWLKMCDIEIAAEGF